MSLQWHYSDYEDFLYLICICRINKSFKSLVALSRVWNLKRLAKHASGSRMEMAFIYLRTPAYAASASRHSPPNKMQSH